jgi:hypothetical protein
MAKVTVFNFRVYDINRDESITSRRMATRPGIESIGGVIIEGSGVEIDETQLEPGEQWTKRDFKPSEHSTTA